MKYKTNKSCFLFIFVFFMKTSFVIESYIFLLIIKLEMIRNTDYWQKSESKIYIVLKSYSIENRFLIRKIFELKLEHDLSFEKKNIKRII